jgi:large subunit ribosomal protein L5
MIRLKEHYKSSVVPELMKELDLDSNMAVPHITKVTLNMGVGEVLQDKKLLEKAAEDMALISGQKPLITKARKSVANFKIRDGMPIGCKVTLRGDRMYDFLQRLIGVAIPRERDFRGLDVRSFDGRGNYSMGIKEHIIFPEIDYDKVDMIRGMDIAISTSAVNDKEGEVLLKAMKFPFKN